MLKRFCYIFLLICCISKVSEAGMIPTDTKSSLFSVGRWLKIETTATGIHKINYSWLKSAGFLHPENVRIFGSRNEAMARYDYLIEDNRPIQIPTLKYKESGGNESILFFVQGDIRWELDASSGRYTHVRNQAARGKSYFFLTEDSGMDLQLPLNTQVTGNPNFQVNDYDECLLWEQENINLLESGIRWFTSMLIGGNQLNKSLQFQDRLENAAVYLSVYAAGRSLSPTGMDVSLNGMNLGNISFKPVSQASEADFASEDSLVTSRTLSGQNLALSLKYTGTSSDQSWFDCATIQYRRNLQYRGNPLWFSDSKVLGKGKIAEYQISGAIAGLQLWEVTNPAAPLQTEYKINNGAITFRAVCDTLRRFLLFDPQNQYPGLIKTEDVKNVDINHTETPQFLILTPTAFLDQAERLAQYHRTNDKIVVAVVTVESIFNEYSGGYHDVCALRNYIKFLYDQKNGSDGSTLKYLLLFGKGTCDPVHEPGENNPDWIPTVQSESSLSAVNSYVSDDFFGRLNPGLGGQTGRVEVGIGRIPAATIAEATTAVDKIVHYHDASTLGEWRNNITFIGDDEDGNLHVNDSEKLAATVNRLNPEYKTAKIYFDAYEQVLTPEERYPDVTEAIRRSVQSGDLIVNYVGHASEDGLAHERVLTVKDIDAWTNKSRLPLFVTATCEFSRWDMTVKRSAGEHLFFNPSGGAIALLSATRLVYSASNFEINKSFFNHVFDRDQQGNPLRLGDLIRLVKNENGGTINTSKFCLLGDPALRLSYPEYRCENTEINNMPLNQFSDTLSPLSMVTIKGEIRDHSGKKIDLFNGKLSAIVYDQPIGKLTLGNGGFPPFSYLVQDNILYNGTVPVKNGAFSYSFVVPKDVNFDKEAGLIRYYFSNGTSDGNGTFANLHFNGTEKISATDTKGPEIGLFLENETFQEGESVSANPLLMVYLNDESGINTSGIGIGHDLTVELDNQPSSRLMLNDYYKADAASWKSGVVIYQLSGLTSGSHTLTFKAWDVANNSAIKTVRFNVNNDLVFNQAYNFPNPFSGQTRFILTHNRYDELFTVKLEVMDLLGQLVYQSQQILPSHGYEIDEVYCNPTLWSIPPVAGLYIYRITITSQDGSHAARSGRMVWRK